MSRTDDELLEMLALRDEGLSRSKIAARFGITKNAVIGALYRIERETDRSEGVKAQRGRKAAA